MHEGIQINIYVCEVHDIIRSISSYIMSMNTYALVEARMLYNSDLRSIRC